MDAKDSLEFCLLPVSTCFISIVSGLDWEISSWIREVFMLDSGWPECKGVWSKEGNMDLRGVRKGDIVFFFIKTRRFVASWVRKW